MRAVRVRAANDRRRLKDVVAGLIRRGLATEQRSVVHGARRVRLPLVICAHSAPPGEEPSPERVAEASCLRRSRRAPCEHAVT